MKFKTSYAGTISINWQQVKALQSDKPVTIMLKTDELISTRLITNDNGTSQFKKEGELRFRSLQDRYIFQGQLENDSTRDKTLRTTGCLVALMIILLPNNVIMGLGKE